MYRCPSNGIDGRTIPWYGGYANMSYPAVHGGGLKHVLDGPHRANGVFGESSSVRMNDIRDGLEHTFLLGERRLTDNGFHGAIWMRSINRAGNGVDGTAVAGVCSAGARLNVPGDPDAFSSAHRNGAHFVMADASVRFIASDIDTEAYSRLAGIADEMPAKPRRSQSK